MHLTDRELWTAVHGMILGAAFLLAFSGGFISLWSYRRSWLTSQSAQPVARAMKIGAWTMAIFAWATVLVGTYTVYPWYRATPPVADLAKTSAAKASLAKYPKYLLLSDERTADWHELGMEWKEHVAWLCPILATAAAFVVTRYRRLPDDPAVRRALLAVYVLCFFCAAVAGSLGALIDKAAPVR